MISMTLFVVEYVYLMSRFFDIRYTLEVDIYIHIIKIFPEFKKLVNGHNHNYVKTLYSTHVITFYTIQAVTMVMKVK